MELAGLCAYTVLTSQIPWHVRGGGGGGLKVLEHPNKFQLLVYVPDQTYYICIFDNNIKDSASCIISK